MQLKSTENIMRNPIGWLRLLNIFIALFFLTGCSDPSHPTAIKILKEIEGRVSLEGQVNLSTISEQFDEICAFQQDDSDDGFALMDMNNLLSKRKISLQHTESELPKNPQRVILLIRNKTAFAVFDGEWTVYYMMLKGREIEDGSICKAWSNSIVIAR